LNEGKKNQVDSACDKGPWIRKSKKEKEEKAGFEKEEKEETGQWRGH
jgi:hypothetical protein